MAVSGVQVQGAPGGGLGMALLLSFSGLPALVPLTTAPFSLPLTGGARGYRGGKLGPGGGERT